MAKLKRRLLSVLVLSLTLILVFGMLVSAQGKIQLRYVTGDAGPAVALQEEIVKSFNESQDRIEVGWKPMVQLLIVPIAAIGAEMRRYREDVEFPAYYQLWFPDDRIDAMADKDDFYPTLFNYADMYGQVYGMPIGFSTRAMHYNKALTDAAGITVENDWTLEDLREAAAAVTKDGVTGLYFYYNPDPYAFE